MTSEQVLGRTKQENEKKYEKRAKSRIFGSFWGGLVELLYSNPPPEGLGIFGPIFGPQSESLKEVVLLLYIIHIPNPQINENKTKNI